MKTALIHDWLEKYGGAERVLSAISEIYDFDFYYTYVNLMTEEMLHSTYKKTVTVEQSKLLKIFKNNFRILLPFFPFIVRRFNKQTQSNKVDLVISSSWALSKAYRIESEIHVCYLQARNFKYIWDEAPLYFNGVYRLFKFLKKPLQRFDIAMSKNPNYLIANSNFVKDWVKEIYNRESTVIYPPVDVDDFNISNNKQDYYITVGRLEPYKRFDVVVNAFNANKKKLIIVGSGTQLEKLKDKAQDNIHFTGFLDKSQIKKLLQEAQAFVYSGVEDFGISLVEALASGIPVIAYEGGAANEIVDNGSNGVLFSELNEHGLNEAIKYYENNKVKFDPHYLKASVQRFSKSNFKKAFKEYIDEITQTQIKKHSL